MYVNSKKVAVLLSTFNGARFLEEQLDSLLHQTSRDFHIYIRDDGSADGTVEIIGRYAAANCEQITFIEDGESRRGAAGSFFHLLESVDSQYYMFCDQDDVWLPQKIEVSLSSIAAAELACCEDGRQCEKPVVAFTDLKVVDAQLNMLHESFNRVNHLERFEQDSDILFVHNVVTGCAMIFNGKAKEISSPVSPYAHMHDEWIALCTYTQGGTIIPIKDALICYRQHGGNTVGAHQYSFIEKIKSAVWQRQLLKKMRLVRSAFGISLLKFLKLKNRYRRA